MDFPAVCSEYSPIWRYPSQPGLSSNPVQFPCVPRQLRFSDPDILLSENICCGQILKIHYTGIYVKNPRSTRMYMYKYTFYLCLKHFVINIRQYIQPSSTLLIDCYQKQFDTSCIGTIPMQPWDTS